MASTAAAVGGTGVSIAFVTVPDKVRGGKKLPLVYSVSVLIMA